ncbi:hypothetical protein PVK06_034176 [Gossypium arboreum]|uniref:CCHC-type domain-containing protein n=1 Tax=Gossypium arboreum TaxID=29729 RepID=A0ABR0NEF1_GOSAR|nr:hypothetical protein PVK06_034176 [Gossypium arboreum]
MELTVIVKFLGRNIGYNALHYSILFLWKPVLVDEVAQRVEYEALPIVCFACGKYGHVKEMCNLVVSSQNLTNLANKADKTSDKPTAVMGSIPMDSMDVGNLFPVAEKMA